ANGSEPISSPAATNKNTFRAPQSSSSGPAISSAAGPASSARVSTAVITLARSASGVRVVITPINGALTRGPKNDEVKSTAITPTTGRSSPSSQSGSVRATSETAPSLIGANLGTR